MPKKSTKTKKKKKKTSELWISPRYSLKGPAGERAWENRPGGAPNSQRYLELADIALGLQQTNIHKKREADATHQLEKTEPYSSQ